MDGDELAACRDALSEIIQKCDSYRGLVPGEEQAEAKPPEEESAPPPEASVEVEIDAAPPPEESSEPEPMSIIDRPASRAALMPEKRGRGRPRKGGY